MNPKRAKLIIVDSITSFCDQINTDDFSILKDSEGAHRITVGNFNCVEIREDESIGLNMVAVYDQFFDGFGEIKRWNYVTKEGR